MKYDTSIKSYLGLTQQEMAIALQITESQWSMYKSGMRDIPTESKNRLADMLQYSKERNKISEARKQLDKAETKKTQQQLLQDYRSAEIKLHGIAKKISILENTRAECFAALETAAYLESQKEDYPKAYPEGIRLRAAKTLKEYSLYHLAALRLKQENLLMLKNRLQQEISPEEKIR